MEITIDMIVMIITAIVTAAFGICAKKWNWESKNYIPFQNLIIGILSGVLVFAVRLNSNILQSIILCVFSAMTAGGTYDLIKTKKEE
ncbi:MAG: hypothetical protein ACLVAK_07940 [Clostridia bacterium]